MVKGLPKSIIKKYGITKKAWAVFRGKKTPSSRVASTSRGKSVLAKRKGTVPGTKRRTGALGGINIKELIFGAGLMTAGKFAVGMVAPGIPFQRQAGTLAGGIAASLTGMPGKKLISYALIDAGSDVMASFLGGAATGTTGGYDF